MGFPFDKSRAAAVQDRRDIAGWGSLEVAEEEDTDVEGIADIVVGDIPDNGDVEEVDNLDMHDTAAVVDIVDMDAGGDSPDSLAEDSEGTEV